MKIVDRMRKEARRRGQIEGHEVLELFKESIEEILREKDRSLDLDAHRPMIVLVVGVNGTGKTTTIGKIARTQADRGRKVMMVAADTFRAAAADQLEIWAQRTGSAIVRREEGADPASVIYEALEAAGRDKPDLVLIDTAGRLHTKAALMEQLTKLRRVIQRHFPEAPHETVLVLDATTGQNALNQVKLFNEACELTGLIMTKLDGTAKGGILIACKDQYQLPIFKIGIGEEIEDLRDFDAHEFAEALFGEPAESS
jgi:fused signal recognition particle receptor